MIFREEGGVLGRDMAVDMNVAPAQVNDPRLSPRVQAYEFITINNLGASSVSQTAFVAPKNTQQYGQYALVGVIVTFGTASTSGTLQVEKATGTQAIAGGTNLLQATLSLSGTANTPVEASGSSAPVTNPNTVQLSGGDRLNLIFAGTMTSLANCSVTLTLARVG